MLLAQLVVDALGLLRQTRSWIQCTHIVLERRLSVSQRDELKFLALDLRLDRRGLIVLGPSRGWS